MSKLSKGKYAQAISDRSGMAFPYNEMVKEWNGSLVHVSEFEAKQPQLEPRRYTGDPQGLMNGLAYTIFENSPGFSITKVDANSYTFNCGSSATVTETAGGMFVTAGPVTLTP